MLIGDSNAEGPEKQRLLFLRALENILEVLTQALWVRVSLVK